jgi:hypothetical protein
LCVAVLASAGCGGGNKRQDANEPRGTYDVEVLEARFPERQKLAKQSDLVIRVRNADSKTIPQIAVTVNGFDRRQKNEGLADPERPVFVINGVPKSIGDLPESKQAAPQGCDTAYVDTWACGRLKPGEERSFRWTVSAVQAGPFRIKYTVAAGLDGKARAVDASSGGRPTGFFVGTISDKPPRTRVGNDGKTVIRGTR